jgi:hypothetical protein
MLDANRNGVYGPYGTNSNTAATPLPIPVAGFTNQFMAFPVDYGDAVPLPVIFTNVHYTSTSKNWGIEANRLFRKTEADRFGGKWEFFGGARYFSYTDQFAINANGGILDSSYWDTTAFNNIVGPQIGTRWSRIRGRLTCSAEARAMAGANFQNAKQQGVVGSNLVQQPIVPIPSAFVVNNPITNTPETFYIYPQAQNPGLGPASGTYRLNQPLNLYATGFNSSKNWVAFSPLVELRAKVSYQLFRSVNISAGWTGIWVDNVAKSTNLMNWVLPNFGITDNNLGHQTIINGLTLGLEFNH